MQIELLDNKYDTSLIDIEVKESFIHLRDFLLNDGKKYIESKLCSIYGIRKKEKIIGYLSISTSMLRLKDTFFGKIEINDLEDIYVPIPCILIGKLLISDKFQGKGYGKELIIAIVSYCYDISKKIGTRFIIVDSHKDAVGFYEKLGFIKISDSGNTIKMVFDLKQFDKITI